MTDRRLPLAIAGVLLAISACTTTGSDSPAGEAGGGWPWASFGDTPATSSTPTKPPSGRVSLDGKSACAIVDESVANKAGVDMVSEGPMRNKWGSTCAYKHEDIFIFTLLTDGPAQGIGRLPPERGAQVSMRRIGTFLARQELYAAEKMCSLAIELTPDRALLIAYRDARDDPEHRCRQVETLATEALAGLEHS